MRKTQLGVISAILAAIVGCGYSNTGPEADYVVLLQSGTTPVNALAGSSVSVAFLVVHGPAGAITTPKSGVAVTFTVISGGGTVAGSTSTTAGTGADGIATESWRLGGSSGVQVLRGSISSTQAVDVSITAIQAANVR
ncbi:MAG: hypothetical protein DMD43_08615 [Gemmatimonadetes bacterium]|nr:MAG: hypothetical protein DMD43_08615 [Gemmatimonadota bacterium]